MIKVAIIGGGATGLMCAAILSKNRGIQVDIIEKEKRVGKKILQTGNGRCNFTNLGVSMNKYNSPQFVKPILDKYTPTFIRETFFSFGLASYSDEEKRCYPLSDTASSVLDVLRNACNNNNVLEKVNHDVIEISKYNKGYKIYCKFNDNEDVCYEYDYIVIATGGSLKPLSFIEKLNLNYTTTKPSLCSIKANVNGLNGIRSNVCAKLFINDKLIKKEYGEVLFKDGALSGIVMFNLSAFISRCKKINKAYIELDLLPTYSDSKTDDLWESRIRLLKNSTIELFMLGLFPKALAQFLLKKCCINPNISVKNCSKKDLMNLKNICKHLIIEIRDNYVSNNYQVVHGGIDLSEVDSNLKLVKYNNIYIGGEVLDIDGECGGYNLHFAFACGLKIADEIKKQ